MKIAWQVVVESTSIAFANGVRFLRSVRRHYCLHRNRWCASNAGWICTTLVLVGVIFYLCLQQNCQNGITEERLILAQHIKTKKHDQAVASRADAAATQNRALREVSYDDEGESTTTSFSRTFLKTTTRTTSKTTSSKVIAHREVIAKNKNIIVVDKVPSLCNDEEDGDRCAFKRMIAVTRRDSWLMSSTWQVCSTILHQMKGAQWYLYGTSLLGYFRHNGSIIPWDDFIDVALFPKEPRLANSYFAKQFRSLVRKFPGYASFYVESQGKIKCFGAWANNSRSIPGRGGWVPKWRWPYVEIQIMLTNFSTDTGLMQTVQDPYWPEYWYPGDDILPLRSVIFESQPVYVPNNIQNVLERNYDINWCTTRFYSHKNEQVEANENFVNRRCSDLSDFVVFTNIEIEVKNLTCPEGDAAEDQSICSFLPALKPSEKAILLETARVCLKIVEKLQGATYFLYGGSLLGYYRHAGMMIPWDDDIDLAVIPLDRKANDNITYYTEQFQKIIKAYPGYEMHFIVNQSKIKCFGALSTNSKAISRSGGWRPKWRWPYIDIQIMKTNFSDNNNNEMADNKVDDGDPATATWQVDTVQDPSGFSSFWYPASLVFPLKRVMFESLSVLVPHEIGTSLKRNYDIKTCVAPYYSHRNERVLQQQISRIVRHSCSELGHMYNFTNIDDE